MDPTLRDLLHDLSSANGMRRKRARETVVLIGDPATPHLRDLLDSGDKKLRWEVAKTLAAMVDASSMPVLIELLRDHESDLRWIAADGLIALGPRVVVPLLKSLLAAPPVKGQGEMAARVLRKLAADNDVLGGIVAPVIEVLKEPDPVVMQPRVSQALSDLSRIKGELPEL